MCVCVAQVYILKGNHQANSIVHCTVYAKCRFNLLLHRIIVFISLCMAHFLLNVSIMVMCSYVPDIFNNTEEDLKDCVPH